MITELYPHQIKCHEAVINKYNQGVLSQLIVLFTGAGKTALLIKLIEKMGFKRVLWLSFQEELVSQSAMAFISDKFDESFYNHVNEIGFLDYVRNDDSRYAMKGFSIGCIKGDIFKPDANVVMGSVMTLARRLDRLPSDYYDLIIADESHLFGSKSAYNVLSHFKPKLLIGATATPYRESGVMLGDIFDEITFDYGLGAGIKDGYCAELDAIKITTNVNLDSVKTTGGDFNNGELSNQVDTLARNQLIVDKWKQHAVGRQTIAFCTNINHAVNLAEIFRLNGINAVAVSSNEELTPDRSENIKRFKEGKIDVITNVGILVAGFDQKDVGCAIMAAPTKSLTRYLQSIGRAARLKTKSFVDRFGQNALILDITDVTTKHNLINCWELDRKKPLEERTFITQEKRDKLLAERLSKKATLEHERDKDEVVKLLSLPEYKAFAWKKMQEPATAPQLKWISDLGYSVTDTVYTKQQCADIIAMEACSKREIEYLVSKGYDAKFASKGQYNMVYYEHEMKNKWKKKR